MSGTHSYGIFIGKVLSNTTPLDTRESSVDGVVSVIKGTQLLFHPFIGSIGCSSYVPVCIKY